MKLPMKCQHCLKELSWDSGLEPELTLSQYPRGGTGNSSWRAHIYFCNPACFRGWYHDREQRLVICESCKEKITDIDVHSDRKWCNDCYY